MRAAQVGGYLGGYRYVRAHHARGSQGGDQGKWAARQEGATTVIRVSGSPRWGGSRGGDDQGRPSYFSVSPPWVLHVRREAVVVALPFVNHSTMALYFYGGPHFLHEHSWLQISSFLSLQAVSSQPTSVPPQVCYPNSTLQRPVPMHTCGHPSQAGVCKAVAQTSCVSLTLSCLPQTSC